ncbi:MAG: DNA internalization-related competence protein ComEC/Rec2 [Halanaerobiales bacterium]|nr:DNA internalization-related competence protein ComEC/Rec2 [Halanaerobiales bacterium]
MFFKKNFIIKAGIFFVIGLINGYYFLDCKLIIILTVCFSLIYFIINHTRNYVLYVLIMILIFAFFYMIYYEISYYNEKSIIHYNGKNVEVVGQIKFDLRSIEGNSLILEPILINNHRVKYGMIQLWKSDLKNNLKHGDIVIANLDLFEVDQESNPGGFSYRNYLKKQNIYSTAQVYEIYKLSNQYLLSTPIVMIKERMLNIIDQNIIPPVNEFIKALVLGEKSNLDPRYESNFRKAGANHLLAISGLHIGFITIFILSILSIFSLNQLTKNIILSILLISYALMTGLRASVLRASLMVIFFRLSKQFEVDLDIYSVLSITLLFILLLDPYQLFSVGLQLSFIVLLMIIAWTKILKKYLHPILAVSIAAQLGSIPLTAYYFNIITPAGVITNLWSIPLISIIIFLSLTHFMLNLILPILSLITAKLIYFSTTFLNYGINIMSKLPSAQIYLTTPLSTVVFLTYISLFLLAYTYHNKNINNAKTTQYLKYINILLIIIIITMVFFRPPDDDLLNICCLDVGQGDSIFIKTPENNNILVDTGGLSKSNNIAETTILPYLLQRNVKVINYLIITHFDYDHCGGAEFLIENGFVKNLIISEHFDSMDSNAQSIIKIALDMNIRVFQAHIDQKLEVDEVKLKFLSPPVHPNFKEKNNNSLVFRLKYKKFTMLFTGDIEGKVEKYILDNKSNLQLCSDILKIAHHGSSTSSLDNFLKAVNPKEALISVGYNYFNQPDPKLIKRLINKQIRVWRTDKQGAIMIKSDGYKYNINSYLN